ncbi:MAG: hypothetical protein JSW54_11025 [Fidelibacterota bacterium]|nr:MAG: hypothetical protein JSW54_11025 [Candidatus Neomarinimicrobiota bacterium]
MARINLTEMIERLELELRPVLKKAVQETLPDIEFDEKALYREFRKAASRRFQTWERVPDSCVKPEY